MSMLMPRASKACALTVCGLMASALLTTAPGAGAQPVRARSAAPAPSVDWTMDLNTLTIFDIQGKIDTDLCADVYGTVTIARGNERHVAWQRSRGNTFQICEPNRSLGEGQQSGRENLDRTVHFSSTAADTRSWTIRVDLKDADPGGKDDVVLKANEVLKVRKGNESRLQNDYGNGRTRASLAYEISPETCGRTAANYTGKTFQGQIFFLGGEIPQKMTFKSSGIVDYQTATQKPRAQRWEMITPSKKIEGNLHPARIRVARQVRFVIPGCTYDAQSQSLKVTKVTEVFTHPNGFVQGRESYNLVDSNQ